MERAYRKIKWEYSKRYNFIKELIDNKLGDMVSYREPKGGLNLFLNINKNIDITSKKLFYELKDRQTIITREAYSLKILMMEIKALELDFPK